MTPRRCALQDSQGQQTVTNMRPKWLLIPLIALFPWPDSRAGEETTELVEKARGLKQSHEYEEAAKAFEALLEAEPKHLEALCARSWLLSQLGDRLGEGEAEKKRKMCQQARELALKAIRLDPKCAEAHYSHVVALGLLTEQETNFLKKGRNGKRIKKIAEKAIKLDPKHDGAHYVLARWHQSLAMLPVHKRAPAALLLGTGSLKKAEKLFRKAIELEAEILYHYELARTLEAMDRKDEAVKTLKASLALKSRSPEDKARQAKCKALLEKLSPPTDDGD